MLSNTIDKDCLEVEFGLFEDLTESDVFNTIYDEAVYISK